MESMTKSSKTRFTAEPGKLDVVITRDFDAPRELVFKAFKDPKLYVQWLGPRRFKMILEKFEPRNGGSYRYIHKDKDGNEYAFHGVYHEVLEPSLMIDTWEFEGLPEKGHVSLQTAGFEEIPGGKTKLTIQAVFLSVADRDGNVQSGMEEGINEGFDRLDELLEKIQKKRVRSQR
ncbi:MAG: SRPBCC family protein [Candidatus Freyarchaeum deiterrae]